MLILQRKTGDGPAILSTAEIYQNAEAYLANLVDLNLRELRVTRNGYFILQVPIKANTGKWYAEAKWQSGNTYGYFGVSNNISSMPHTTNAAQIYNAPIGTVVGIVIDTDTNTVDFYRNGTLDSSSFLLDTTYTSTPVYLVFFNRGSGSGYTHFRGNYAEEDFVYDPSTYGATAFNKLSLT